MRHLIGITFVLGFIGCGQNNETATTEPTNTAVTDSSGIIEYNLDKERISAVDFNNELTLMQQGVLEQIDLVFTADSSNLTRRLDNAKFEIALKKADLDALFAPEGGDEFKMALMNLLNFYSDELSTNFTDLVPILEKSNPSENESLKLDRYSEQFMANEDSLFAQIVATQEIFAQENNFKIQ